MELWKETFHDSDRYIDLVFNTYFDPENVFVRFDGDRLVAMMLCISYPFRVKTCSGTFLTKDGVYLCGLATRPEYRRMGIMSRLMNEAEDEMIRRGKDLLFLIPADEHLRSYYARMGYYNATMRRAENIRFSEKVAVMTSHPLRPLIKPSPSFVDALGQCCSHIDLKRNESCIVHRPSDMIAVFKENENAFLITEETFNSENPDLGKVAAVVFPDSPVGTINDKITISGVYCIQENEMEDVLEIEYMRRSITNSIAVAYAGSDVTFMKTCTDRGDSHAQPYAMVKIIQRESADGISEDTLFDISLMLD